MKRRLFSHSTPLVLIPVLLVFLSGCGGYTFSKSGPVVLPEDKRDIAISKVANPTTEVWLEPRLRQLLRDEMNNRGWTRWVDRNRAQALLRVEIISYSRRTALKGLKESTLLLDATIKLRATLTDTHDQRLLWDSGMVVVNEPYLPGEEEQADSKVTDQAVRRLVDRMTQDY